MYAVVSFSGVIKYNPLVQEPSFTVMPRKFLPNINFFGASMDLYKHKTRFAWKNSTQELHQHTLALHILVSPHVRSVTLLSGLRVHVD